MTLKEAINIANQFNDTIFTNTQEMVNAVTVLIDYAESNKPKPITGKFLDVENIILRRMLWLNHGHTGQYGDDGEMQCAMCWSEYGFYDWKKTPAAEIEEKIRSVGVKKLIECINKKREVNDGE